MTENPAPADVAYQSAEVTLYHGDCLNVLAQLPDQSVDSIVTDPPYGLANTDPAHVIETITRWINGDRDYLPGGAGFMGKAWDAFVPPVAVWDECLRVLKPGGHLLAFAGSRTDDLMGLSIRLAGFEIRDGIAWLYGSGFPKSLDVSKAIDNAAGAQREVVGMKRSGGASALTGNNVDAGPSADAWRDKGGAGAGLAPVTAPATDAARQWDGWGTALKPAFEPIVVARKPLTGTVAANVLAHGTGALNIDANRIGSDTGLQRPERRGKGATGGWAGYAQEPGQYGTPDGMGRFPANVILDDHTATELDQQTGITSAAPRVGARSAKESGTFGAFPGQVEARKDLGDSGGASRFFYTAKADSAERPVVNGIAHPTVKPLDLMRWLVRLVTPTGGTVLEPFAGSGTTLEAAVLEGFRAIGIEREADYIPLIEARLDKPHAIGLDLFGELA